MKNKKIIKLLTLALSIIMLISALPLSIFAEDGSYIENIETSDITMDLTKMLIDMSKFEKDENADYISIVDFLEYGYDYNGDVSRYGLYLYIFNPSGKAIDVYSTRNVVSLQAVVDKVGLGFSNYRLVYCDSTDDNLLYKFKINIPTNYMRKLSKALRRYEIGDIEIKFEGVSHKSYAVSGAWEYQGYQAFCGVDRTSQYSTLTYKATDLLTLEIDLHSVSWLSDSSDVGYDFKYEVFGAYFSVPDYIIEQYGNANDPTKGLYAIDGVYQKHDINGIITKHYDLYETALEYAGKSCKLYDVPIGFTTHRQNVNGVHLDHFTYNHSKFFQIFPTDERSRKLYIYDTAFCLSASEIENADYFSKVCFEYLKEYLESLGLNNVYKNYSIKADSGDMAKQILTFSNANKNNLWHWLNGRSYLFDEERNIYYDNLQPIVYVTSVDVNFDELGKEAVSDALYIDESYLADLKSYVDSSSNNKKTTFLFRYDIEDYFCGDIKVAVEGSGNDMGFDEGNYYFQKTAYTGLDVLSLTWKNNSGGVKIIPVAATSITNSGIITKPDDLDNPLADLFDGAKNKWEEFLDSLTPLVIVMGLTVFVVIYYLWNLWLSPKAIERTSEHAHKERIERYKVKQKEKSERKQKKNGGKK